MKIALIILCANDSMAEQERNVYGVMNLNQMFITSYGAHWDCQLTVVLKSWRSLLVCILSLQ